MKITKKRTCNTIVEVADIFNHNTEALVRAINDINIKIKKLKKRIFPL